MKVIVVLLFTLPQTALAAWTVSPRVEFIQGSKKDISRRLVTNADFNLQGENWLWSADAFFDVDFVTSETLRTRRGQSRAYLQELFFEWRISSLYLRFGRQPLRWSDSWILPSLDLWTGRKWNRLLLDPLDEQLNHSSGITAIWAGEDLSFEGAFIPEVAQSQYPEPLPETFDKSEGTSGGLRIRRVSDGLNWSVVLGRADRRDMLGFSLNTATDFAVPKLEVGELRDNTRALSVSGEVQHFLSAGADIFVGNWTWQPQMTLVRSEDRFTSKERRSTIFYFSGSRSHRKHEWQWQFYRNQELEDFYGSLEYRYALDQLQSFSGFVKNYQGSEKSPLFRSYSELTGGWTVGVSYRLDLASK
ncbi:MAG: hypothetical protein N2578_03265 [Bdellovibrionaceae bacterium]|nr:hypothetical protein [Pseudobdellovibrionaceae bacterium]